MPAFWAASTKIYGMDASLPKGLMDVGETGRGPLTALQLKEISSRR